MSNFLWQIHRLFLLLHIETSLSTSSVECDPNLLSKLTQLLKELITILDDNIHSLAYAFIYILQLTVKSAPQILTNDSKTFYQWLSENKTFDEKRLPASKYDTVLINNLLTLFEQCEHKDPYFAETLHELLNTPPTQLDCQKFNKIHEDFLYFFHHQMVYYLHRYFLESVFTDEPVLEIQRNLLLCTAQYLLCVHQWLKAARPLTYSELLRCFWIFSREIEHSIPNMERIENALLYTDHFSPDKLYEFFGSFTEKRRSE